MKRITISGVLHLFGLIDRWLRTLRIDVDIDIDKPELVPPSPEPPAVDPQREDRERSARGRHMAYLRAELESLKYEAASEVGHVYRSH